MSIVYAVGVVQGMLLTAVLLLIGTANKVGNKLLALLIFLSSLFLLEEYVKSTEWLMVYPRVLMSTFTFDLALGPLTYLYALSLTSSIRPSGKDFFHLLPFIVATLFFLPFHFSTEEGGLVLLNQSYSLLLGILVNFKVLFVIVYLVMAATRLRKHVRLAAPSNNIVHRKWILVFICLITAGLAMILVLSNLGINSDPPSALLLVINIYGIAFIAMRFPMVFSEPRPVEYYQVKLQQEEGSRYRTSSLGTQQKALYTKNLLEYMEKSKPYRVSTLKIEDLADRLSMPPHHLSQIINEVLEKNFYEFLNSYRIKEVQENILDPKQNHKTLLGIAIDAGFNSKATFNRVFKEFTGCSPKEYIARTGHTAP